MQNKNVNQRTAIKIVIELNHNWQLEVLTIFNCQHVTLNSNKPIKIFRLKKLANQSMSKAQLRYKSQRHQQFF